MNLGLWRSGHAFLAAGLVAALLAWHFLAPLPFGSRDDRNVLYLLTTGWIAVACYIVLALYAVRRAAHRLRLSPEFAWKAQLPALERAQSQLRELQNRAARREVAGANALRSAAKAIVREHGVHKVLRIEVEPDPAGLGLFRVRALPREALGRLAGWLHAHVFYGVAAAIIVFCHGGFRCGTTMGLWLNALSYFVIGSGLFGAIMWTFGPTWLTRAERELSIEKADALLAHYDRKLVAANASIAAATGDALTSVQQDLAVLQGQRALVAREAARLERFRFLLRGWRLLHVPASVLLLALVAVHVLSIYYY
jgi:hypothetical protein